MNVTKYAINMALIYGAWYIDGLHGNWEARSFIALVFLAVIAAKETE